MSLRVRSYILIVFSIFLFIIPLYVGNSAISNAKTIIQNIQDELLNLVELTYAVKHNVQEHRTLILEKMIRKEEIDLSEEGFALEDNIKLLDLMVERTDNTELKGHLARLHKRIIAFKLVEESMVGAWKNGEKIDFTDALAGYDSVTEKVTSDVTELQDLSGIFLSQAISQIQERSDKAKKLVIYSIFGGIILLLFAFYSMHRLNEKYKTQTERALEAEAEQRKLQKRLENYSHDLECDVAKKTEELEYRYYHHPLTQLPNRNRLIEDIRNMGSVNIALFNLDKFQEFNDYFGEELGNIAIKEMAGFLKESTPDSCGLYHVNGDEFALLSNKVRVKEEFAESIRELQQRLNSKQFVYGEDVYFLTASVGVASSSFNQLACADIALKEAKKHHTGLSVYTSTMEMEKVYESNLRCSKKLVHAINSGNVVPYYQPIVSLKESAAPARYEGLARMIEEDGTVTPPFQFLDIAKRLRLYPEITRAMFYKVLETIQNEMIAVSINLSVDDINNSVIVEMITNALDSFEYNHFITFEILETEAMDNYADVQLFIDSVRSFGAKVAIDDFGSGYSNFSHILNIEVDYIKIDSSLISNIDTDKNSKIMVETIVKLAQKLGIETVAEFVSSEAIYNTVKDLGVDWAQGYWLGKPVPFKEIKKSLS
ncbi:bifunctional diguanylate cyclase/phosphodiesterase [Sulfurimonas sp. HSL3-7]|uniref:EAL domain-containing protein n=1 Tax=Sulfonitrofixus jiaomeiensis TaxID=3131938 RepID=UPI0031F7AEDF